jgi:hypothetical protein
MGEKDISLSLSKKMKRNFFYGKNNLAGREVLLELRSFPGKIIIREDAELRGLNPDFKGIVLDELSDMSGNQRNPPFPGVLIFSPDSDKSFHD